MYICCYNLVSKCHQREDYGVLAFSSWSKAEEKCSKREDAEKKEKNKNVQ